MSSKFLDTIVVEAREEILKGLSMIDSLVARDRIACATKMHNALVRVYGKEAVITILHSR